MSVVASNSVSRFFLKMMILMINKINIFIINFKITTKKRISSKIEYSFQMIKNKRFKMISMIKIKVLEIHK